MNLRTDQSSLSSLPGNAEEPSRFATAPESFAAARSAKRALLEELRGGWEVGTPVRPEDLLPRWPTDPAKDADVASLLFEDYLQRRQQGQDASVGDYEERFPAHKDSLADLFRDHAVLASVGGASAASGARLALPSVGDELFGFRLRQELGRGAFARVFLAEQAELAGRAVVLKISGTDGTEPQTLAQLQHTHIVPIYSVHEDARAGLRVVCMPYFGGASLSAVLRACWAETGQPVRGAQLVDALHLVQAPPPSWARATAQSEQTPAPNREPQPALALLARTTYCRAAAWIVARLAEALDHAHQRGVLHRDVKPSNILLGASGEPMLLDFNLAQCRQPAEEQAHAALGGTVAYMAPEHLHALAARDPALAARVDERADIYGLGMVLYELLTGRSPFDQSGSYTLLPPQIEAMALERSRTVPSVRRCRPDVPWGLESIVRKCLAPDPANRYRRAEHLAADLHAFLHDLPLRYAPELSWKERARKWARRHPRLTSSASVATIAALLLGVAVFMLLGIRNQLGAAQALERQRAYRAGTVRALCLVNTTTDVGDHLRRGEDACAETLALYSVLDREDWEDDAAWQRLTLTERQALGEDTRELLQLLAWARTRTPGRKAATPDILKAALGLLDRAEAIRGLPPSRALWEDRAYYLDLLKDSVAAKAARARAKRLKAASARDHYLLATALVRQSTPDNRTAAYARALAELNRAVRANPRHYWSWLQRGICYQELGEHTLAAADFGICIGLQPDFAWGHFNRGCALEQSGKRAEAIMDYTAALGCDPGFALAWLNRGLANLELKQYQQALADFQKARDLGHDEAFLHAGRGVALEGLERTAEADVAFAAAFERAAATAAAVRNRIRWVYGFAVARRLPAKADEAFAEVLEQDPNHPQALYGRAMLLVERRGDLDQAIQLFSRALEVSPGFVDARRFRAVLLARRGRCEEASRDINTCLEREPTAGATLYAAACVAARIAEQAGTRAGAQQAASEAVAFLRLAFAHGYGQDRAATDPDLAALRQQPEFRQLVQSVLGGGKNSKQTKP